MKRSKGMNFRKQCGKIRIWEKLKRLFWEEEKEEEVQEIRVLIPRVKKRVKK